MMFDYIKNMIDSPKSCIDVILQYFSENTSDFNLCVFTYLSEGSSRFLCNSITNDRITEIKYNITSMFNDMGIDMFEGTLSRKYLKNRYNHLYKHIRRLYVSNDITFTFVFEMVKTISEQLYVEYTQQKHTSDSLSGPPFKEKDRASALDDSIVYNQVPLEKESTVDFDEDQGILTSKSETIKTLEQLLEIAKVDLDTWEVERYEVNKWDVARKKVCREYNWKNGKIDNGYLKDGSEMEVQPMYQVKVWLKKKFMMGYKEFLQMFKEDVKTIETIQPKSPTLFKNNKSGNLFVMGIVDQHIGKSGNSSDTGYSNYELEDAIKTFEDTVALFIDRANKNDIDKVLFLVGNDFLNIDSSNQSTTRGTPQHQSLRWKTLFREGCKVITKAINSVAEQYPVDVMVVAGNHDSDSTFALGEYVDAMFSQNNNVEVINNATPRQYYRWGNNLIGFTHGHGAKWNDLPGLMANESQDWSSCFFKYFLTAHLHHQIVKEAMGVKVETLPSLCGVDVWHAENGFCGNTRASKGFIYNKKHGEIANFFYNLGVK